MFSWCGFNIYVCFFGWNVFERWVYFGLVWYLDSLSCVKLEEHGMLWMCFGVRCIESKWYSRCDIMLSWSFQWFLFLLAVRSLTWFEVLFSRLKLGQKSVYLIYFNFLNFRFVWVNFLCVVWIVLWILYLEFVEICSSHVEFA